MIGLGFWKPAVTKMEPNVAYLDADFITDSELINAPGYILKFTENGQEVVTDVANVKTNAQVTSVKYINVAGMVSNRPFEGINIIETTYTDGTKTVTKVVK